MPYLVSSVLNLEPTGFLPKLNVIIKGLSEQDLHWQNPVSGRKKQMAGRRRIWAEAELETRGRALFRGKRASILPSMKGSCPSPFAAHSEHSRRANLLRELCERDGALVLDSVQFTAASQAAFAQRERNQLPCPERRRCS